MDPIFYDPWGELERGTVPTFGFTGELQEGRSIYLRARWYDTGRGTFGSCDPFAGNAEQPYSLSYYQYAYSAPTMWRDATGWMVHLDNSATCTEGDLDCTRERKTLINLGIDIEEDAALCDWPLDELILVRAAPEDLIC